MKKDGHTHTQYCLHGSREETEKYVIKAIEEGFDIYTFTEHLPIPGKFYRQCAYSPEIMANNICMKMNEFDLDKYVREMHYLKNKYKDKINLMVGFEIDYLQDYSNWMRALIKEYKEYIDEIIISVHFIKGIDGWYNVAFDKDDFVNKIIKYYGSVFGVQKEYLGLIKQAVTQDYGIDVPKRIGHMMICDKFQLYYKTLNNEDKDNQLKDIIIDTLNDIKNNNFGIDVNFSGISHKYYNDICYPNKWILNCCIDRDIDLTYGSDCHKTQNIGRGYEEFEKVINKLS